VIATIINSPHEEAVFIFPDFLVARDFPNVVAAVNQMVLGILSAIATSARANWTISFKRAECRWHPEAPMRKPGITTHETSLRLQLAVVLSRE
jgi:hypothetical protein